MGRFVEIAVAASELSAEQAAQVASACPVDIYALAAGGTLAVVAENEDECILCGRCVEIAPAAITVSRAYGSRRQVNAAGGGLDGA
jgi:NAD-dependent dihydropyrimidine dehydrogenase PreA subunit